MSQRPPASRPGSRSPQDGQRIILPSLQLRDDPQAGGRQVERLQQEQPELRGYPPIQPSPQHGQTPQAGTPGEEWRSGPSRDLGVHSILNPTEPEGAQGTPSSSRRVSSGNTESPLSAAGPPSQFLPSPTQGTHTFPGQPPSTDASPIQEGYRPTFARSQGRSPRRILTPKSRAPSMGRGREATSFDARGSPFIAQRGRSGYTAGPGQSEIPPMPTPPGQQQQQQYGFPPPDNAPAMGRRPSMSSMQAPGRTPLSQSASPSISASSANPSSSQTSPASFLYKGGPPPPTSGSYFPGSTFAPSMGQAQGGGGGMQFQAPSASGTEGPYSAPPPSASASTQSAGSSRQTSDPVQMMQIQTAAGIYNVPVDVHQASRLADEKRARNAGASARFRQRRKEKEKEASTTIEKMQQQTRDLERRVREVEQERDFYRGERDRFRDVIYRTPEMRHLAMQAPPSPQSMRASSFAGPPGGPSPSMNYQPQASPVSERPTRRRRTDTTGDFTTVPYSLPPASTLPPVQAPAGYAASGPTNLPPMRIENPTLQQSSTSSIVPTTTTGAPYDPYRPYDRGYPPRDEGGRR